MAKKQVSRRKLQVLTAASCDLLFALWKLRGSSDGSTVEEVSRALVPPIDDVGTVHQRVRRLRKSNEEYFAAHPQDLKWFLKIPEKLKAKLIPDWTMPADWQFRTRPCIRLSTTQEGYQMKHHATIVYPRTAYLCVKIKERYENERAPLCLGNYSNAAKKQRGLIEIFKEMMGESEENIIDDLNYILRQRYLYGHDQEYRLDGKLPKYIIPAPRLDYEFGYIKSVAQEYKKQI